MEFDCESDVDVDMDVVSSVRSRRTAFTRSLAILDQDSRRLCANQHGPNPLIINCLYQSDFCLFLYSRDDGYRGKNVCDGRLAIHYTQRLFNCGVLSWYSVHSILVPV